MVSFVSHQNDSGNIVGRSDFKTCWQMGMFSIIKELNVWKRAIVTHTYRA